MITQKLQTNYGGINYGQIRQPDKGITKEKMSTNFLGKMHEEQ